MIFLLTGVSANGETASPLLSERQIALLLEWSHSHQSPRAEVQLPYLEPHLSLIALSDLPQVIRHRLFTEQNIPLTPKALRARLESMGLRPQFHPVLKPLLDRYEILCRETTNPYRAIESAILRLITLPIADLMPLKRKIRRQMEIARLTEILSDRRSPQYELHIEGDRLILPDASVYPIIEASEDGSLVVRAPVRLIVSAYRPFWSKPRPAAEAAIPAEVVADGHFLVPATLKPKARLVASQQHGTVPIRLSPAEDGNFYATTHFQVLRWYEPEWEFSLWQHMSDQDFFFHSQRIEESPLDYFRAVYHASISDNDPSSLNCHSEKISGLFNKYVAPNLERVEVQVVACPALSLRQEPEIARRSGPVRKRVSVQTPASTDNENATDL